LAKEPDYRGIAALVIAICGALGAFIIVPVALMMGTKLGDGRVLIAIGGTLIGALAVYMGMRLNGHGKDVLPPHQAPPKSAHTKENDNDTQAD